MNIRSLSDSQLDALRELANIGSGHAAADLSGMIGTSIQIHVPRVVAMSLARAIDQIGRAGEVVTSVMVPTTGGVEAVLVSVYRTEQAEAMCAALGLDPGSELGRSMLAETGNLLACAYGGVIAEMSSLSPTITPPVLVTGALESLVATLAPMIEPDADGVLFIDSQLQVRGSGIGLNVLFVPTAEGISTILAGLGL